jgi:hypothetical protein
MRLLFTTLLAFVSCIARADEDVLAHLRAGHPRLLLTDEQLAAVEAVRSYHAALGRLGIRPQRPLDDDLAITHTAAAYGG